MGRVHHNVSRKQFNYREDDRKWTRATFTEHKVTAWSRVYWCNLNPTDLVTRSFFFQPLAKVTQDFWLTKNRAFWKPCCDINWVFTKHLNLYLEEYLTVEKRMASHWPSRSSAQIIDSAHAGKETHSTNSKYSELHTGINVANNWTHNLNVYFDILLKDRQLKTEYEPNGEQAKKDNDSVKQPHIY